MMLFLELRYFPEIYVISINQFPYLFYDENINNCLNMFTVIYYYGVFLLWLINIHLSFNWLIEYQQIKKFLASYMQSFHQDLKIDIHIFTVNLEGMICDTFQRRETWAVMISRSGLLRGSIFFLMVSFPPFMLTTFREVVLESPWFSLYLLHRRQLGSKCFRRNSEQKWLPSELAVVQLPLYPPLTKINLEFLNFEPWTWAWFTWAGMWSGSDVSGEGLSAFSPHPELSWCYQLSSTNYTVLIYMPLKNMPFSRL